ncbi:MAG: nucleotidyltransferase family protein [Eubacteriales bacterium]|nr:nucleotidyltransferase family protein [Eubacteriales bacterium]
MRVVGVVAEYNPLHNGHIYQLEQAKKRTGAAYCIVAMSGNFVQRGEPACTDKFTRAEWALRAGADLVIEIPSVFANSSAERFAEGAIRLLAQTGIVTDLAFGCEEDDLDILYKLSDILSNETPEFQQTLAIHLKQGKSYPRARYDALEELGMNPVFLRELAKPNNILAIEYLRCINRFAQQISPCPIRRIQNAYNDVALSGQISSATAIRAAFKSGDPTVNAALPLFVSGALQFDEQFPITINDIGAMMLYKLRHMSDDEVREIPDVSEGFEQVIARAARQSYDTESFFAAVKSKRYTLARCKRIGMCALLNISEELTCQMRKPINGYLRVLGLRKSARSLLSAIVSVSNTPLIMRNSDQKCCTPTAQQSLYIDSFSTDVLSYALGKELHKDNQSAITL